MGSGAVSGLLSGGAGALATTGGGAMATTTLGKSAVSLFSGSIGRTIDLDYDTLTNMGGGK